MAVQKVDVNECWQTSDEVAGSRPRRRDSAGVRARILAAAGELFTQRGYAHVGVREITARAGADVSMVKRYFGSKEKLFEAAVADVISPRELWARPREDFGRSVVRDYIEGRDNALTPLTMIMRTAADPDAKAVTLRLVQTEIVQPFAQWLGEPDAETRAARILALCAGLFTYRVMLPLPALSGAMDPRTRRWFEEVIQDLVDGKPLASAAPAR